VSVPLPAAVAAVLFLAVGCALMATLANLPAAGHGATVGVGLSTLPGARALLPATAVTAEPRRAAGAAAARGTPTPVI